MRNFVKWPGLFSALILTAACSGPDVGTRIAGKMGGVAAADQRVSGATILMTPKLEDVNDNSFNIRYLELSFGTGTPSNVRDMAIEQCEKLDKTAIYKTTTRGLIQLNSVKAYYECVDK